MAALGDPTRRAILARLASGPATVGELAAPFRISQQAVSKHVACLQRARLVKKSRDGRRRACANRVTYREIVRPERLVYTHDSGVDGDPSAFEVTVTFAAQGEKTLLTMRSVFSSAEARERAVKEYGAIEGGKQTLERLAEHLSPE